MARTQVSDTIHAKGFSIRIYTTDFRMSSSP